MKKILLLTNIYPNNDPNYGGTKVCHSFTTEWVKMGFDVRVIHFDSLFPRPYYWIGKLFNSRIQAKTGTVAYTNTPRHPKQYKVDDVPVLFVPLKKYIPHKAPSQEQTDKAFKYIVETLKQEGFTPDVITAHFALPQLQFLPLFKQQYPDARTCLVLHGNSSALLYFYPKDYQELMKSVDVWGFRSLAFQQDFAQNYGNEKPMFLCHSGIPEKYLEPVSKDFEGGVKRFVFVGSLYELKNVDITLRALHKAMNGKVYTFDIVGSGAENENLHHLVDELGMKDNVVFHGQMKRDEAQKVVRDADCFIMVSTREAFGLVYVEAMAKGLIVVGTEGQGIDGIVKHGENGFLCKSRDVDGLAEVITNITSLSQQELKLISDKAVVTASNLTDRKVAENYINAIIK
ncbi:MAG: glycosyltransferase family 4 protein [Bacteroidales bacterium]|nr:glycosyltransferase family 4 protein [Bacteroidales bacterium]